MRLRTALFSALSFAVVVSAAAASEAPGIYVSLTAASAAACARACAEDSICMAWSFHAHNQCRLRATVPGQADAQAVAAGFASRAPTFLQQEIPIVHAAPVIADSPAPPSETAVVAKAEDSGELLGGPGEGDLRLGLR